MSLLGIKISLSVVITEGDRNSDKAIGESHTANISRKTWSIKLNFFYLKEPMPMIVETKNPLGSSVSWSHKISIKLGQ